MMGGPAQVQGASLQHRGPVKTGGEQAVGAGSLSTRVGGVGTGSSLPLGIHTGALADVTLRVLQMWFPQGLFLLKQQAECHCRGNGVLRAGRVLTVSCTWPPRLGRRMHLCHVEEAQDRLPHHRGQRAEGGLVWALQMLQAIPSGSPAGTVSSPADPRSPGPTSGWPEIK